MNIFQHTDHLPMLYIEPTNSCVYIYICFFCLEYYWKTELSALFVGLRSEQLKSGIGQIKTILEIKMGTVNMASQTIEQYH